jgi:hypothetical protein
MERSCGGGQEGEGKGRPVPFYAHGGRVPGGAGHPGRLCLHRDTRHSSSRSGEKRRVGGEAGRTPEGERLHPRGQGAMLWQRSCGAG